MCILIPKTVTFKLLCTSHQYYYPGVLLAIFKQIFCEILDKILRKVWHAIEYFYELICRCTFWSDVVDLDAVDSEPPGDCLRGWLCGAVHYIWGTHNMPSSGLTFDVASWQRQLTFRGIPLITPKQGVKRSPPNSHTPLMNPLTCTLTAPLHCHWETVHFILSHWNVHIIFCLTRFWISFKIIDILYLK